MPSSGSGSGALCCGAVAGLFTYRLTREMFGAAERPGGRGPGADPAVLFLERLHDDTRCAAYGGVGGCALLSVSRADRGSSASLVGRGCVSGAGTAVEVHDRAPGIFNAAFHADRSALAPCQARPSPMRRLSRGGDFLAGDRVERAARVCIVCLPDFAAARRAAAVRAAEAHRLGAGAVDADRCAGGVSGLLRRREPTRADRRRAKPPRATIGSRGWRFIQDRDAHAARGVRAVQLAS